MISKIPLTITDTNSPVPKLLQTPEAVPSPARRSALTLGVAICGAALLWRPNSAGAALRHGDIQAVRFLEEVEEMQNEFFTRAALSNSAAKLNSREREVLHTIARHDSKHSEWFALARGKYGVSKHSGFYAPNASQSRPLRPFTFPIELFSNREQLLQTAIELKETAVGAYFGQLQRVREAELRKSIAALAGVEARHAAALNELGAPDYRPAASEMVLSSAQVISRWHEFGFRGEGMQ